MTSNKQIHWHDYDVAKATKCVKQYQTAIAVAYRKGNKGESERYQHNLIRSRSAAYVAVRQVARLNRGKGTPGIDGITWNTPELKEQAVKTLRNRNWKEYKASTVRRVYIPKARGGLRPLGIPTRIDRAAQSLWQMALDPIAECGADQNSYGFRKARRTNDAAQRIFLLCARKKRKPKWVRDADIKGMFDNISHQWVEANIPINNDVLKQWLKAGALGMNNEKIAINAGVPQGGTISPTIANMVLDGLEECLKDEAPRRKANGKAVSAHVHVIRYADDFLVTRGSRDVMYNFIKPKVEEFLSERGLELNRDKTSIKEIDKGFDFLGYRFGRYTTIGKKNTPRKIFLIKPTKPNVKRLRQRISEIVKDRLGRRSGELIGKLNPVLRGWAEYYKGTSAKEIYGSIDNYLWRVLWRWSKRKNTGVSKFDIAAKYFTKVGKRNWVFTGELNRKKVMLYNRKRTKIKRHLLIEKNRNPYLPEDQEYFEKREQSKAKYALWNSRTSKVLKRQDYRCPVCEQIIKSGEEVDIHHVVPRSKGGRNVISNLKVLHMECHRSVTFARSKKALARYHQKGVIG